MLSFFFFCVVCCLLFLFSSSSSSSSSSACNEVLLHHHDWDTTCFGERFHRPNVSKVVAHDKCSKALQNNPPDSRYIVFYTKDQRPKMSNKPEERDESQGGHRARAYTKHKHKPLTPEAILLEEV